MIQTELAPGYFISRVINGCWQLTPDHGGGPATEAKTLRMFSEAVEHGFTTFDCADIYTGVEQLLGRFRRSLPNPDQIQIHTKLVPDKASLHQLNASQVDDVIHRSMRRLGVEQLDLVQFHWWDYQVSGLELLIERLLMAQQDGKIRLLGATNFNTKHMEQMIGQGLPLVSLQTQYSLLDRRPEKKMTALASKSKIQLLPYGALAGGFLSEKYLGAPAPDEMNRSLTKYRLIIEETGGWNSFQDLLQILAVIARKHAVPLSLVAARWLLEQQSVGAIILGTGGRSRVADNLKLARLELDEEDRQSIQSYLDQQPIPAGDMFDLERVEGGAHANIMKTDLQQAKH